MANPDEPLFTIGIAADLLGTDTQSLRRLEDALSHASARPSGNQRRYSQRDLEVLELAVGLSAEGFPPQALPRLVELERQVQRISEG